MGRFLDTFLHGKRILCGVSVTPKILERTVLHLIDRRGHLILDERPRAGRNVFS